jgi:DNA-binding transcriptional LysR family regulator
MRNLNLDQLQTLVAIDDLGTLAAAAQALHLAPPTVSLHISELEGRLETPLLNRGRRQATLTPAGQALVTGARRILADCDAVVEHVRRRAQGLEGTVRLAATAGVSPRLLPEMLQRLARRSPGIDMRLDMLGTAEALDRLKSGALDIAIVAQPLAAEGGIAIAPWRSDPMLAFVPAAWKAPKKITPQWLAERGWMSFGAPTQMQRLVAAWFGRAGLNPRPRLELSHPQALTALVAAGHGAALLPREEPAEAFDPAVVQVRELDPPLPRLLAIASREADADDAAIAKVLAVLKGFSNVKAARR